MYMIINLYMYIYIYLWVHLYPRPRAEHLWWFCWCCWYHGGVAQRQCVRTCFVFVIGIANFVSTFCWPDLSLFVRGT